MAAEPRRSRRAKVLLAIVVVALIVVLGWIDSRISWEEKEIDRGYAEAAMQNQFLAAERFLEAQGIAAETVTGLGMLDDLPSRHDTIILASSRRSMSERRRLDLMAWIETGGQLIVVAQEPYREESPETRDILLTHYGIQLLAPEEEEEGEEVDEEDVAEDEGVRDEDLEGEGEGEGEEDRGGERKRAAEIEAESEAHDAIEPEDEPADAVVEPRGEHGDDEQEVAGEDELDHVQEQLEELLGGSLSSELPECVSNRDQLAYLVTSRSGENAEPDEAPLILELDSDNVIWAPDERGATAYGRAGAQLVHRPVERGAITASTSLAIWSNRRIHCHDHAYLLWKLTENSDKVWLLYDPAVPSLGSLLATHYPLAIEGLIALLVIWAASRSLRFGPPVQGLDAPRRELLEHLDAGAHFLWRQNAIRDAIAPLRDDVLARIGGRSGLGRPASPEQIRHLASLTRIPDDEIAHALLGEAPTKRRDFHQLMKTLQAIRRHL